MLGADPERAADGVHIPSYIQSADPSRARTGREQSGQDRAAAGGTLQSVYLYCTYKKRSQTIYARPVNLVRQACVNWSVGHSDSSGRGWVVLG